MAVLVHGHLLGPRANSGVKRGEDVMDLIAAPFKHLTQTQTRAFMVYGVNLCVFVLMSDYEAESPRSSKLQKYVSQQRVHFTVQCVQSVQCVQAAASA